MLQILAFIAILHPLQSKADELVLGLVTGHIYNVPGVSQGYEGCLHFSCEVIYNPILAYRFTQNKYIKKTNSRNKKVFKVKDSYTANTFLIGLNSIHEPMVGYYHSFGSWVTAKNKLGLVGGAYIQDNNKFLQRNIVAFSIYENSSIGVVPIVGIEHQYFIDKAIFTSAIITPAVVNIGFGISF